MKKPKLVLLDRDGVINVSPGRGYVTTLDQMVLFEGSGEAIALLNQHNIPVAIITNQSIVGQGGLSLEDLTSIHDHLMRLLEHRGAKVDKIYVCTDPPWAPTFRRKPNPGMIEEALHDFNTLAREALFIGDSLTDLEAAQKVHVPFFLVRTGHGAESEEKLHEASPTLLTVFDDLKTAVRSLLGGKPWG